MSMDSLNNPNIRCFFKEHGWTHSFELNGWEFKDYFIGEEAIALLTPWELRMAITAPTRGDGLNLGFLGDV